MLHLNILSKRRASIGADNLIKVINIIDECEAGLLSFPVKIVTSGQDFALQVIDLIKRIYYLLLLEVKSVILAHTQIKRWFIVFCNRKSRYLQVNVRRFTSALIRSFFG